MSRMLSHTWWLVAGTLACCSGLGLGKTIHVPADQLTIQAGINAASPGDTVLVASGTYHEHDIVMGQGVCLTSETGNPDCVIIDAEWAGRVFYCEGLDSSAMLVGLTIYRGSAVGGQPGGEGGGILCVSASPLLANCFFHYNRADYRGAGLCCKSGSSPAVTDCRFRDNTTDTRGGGVACTGGSSPTMSGCWFVLNESLRDGGGAWCEDSDPQFINCRFKGNSAQHDGGGLFGVAEAAPVLTRCLFQENGAQRHGGALMCQGGSSVELSHCTIYANRAVLFCSGVYVQGSGSSVTISHCIIAWNGDGSGPPVSCATGGTVDVTCSDVFGNESDWAGCIEGQQTSNGNLWADPLFCNRWSGDLTIDASSPCAPLNSSCGELIGAYDVGCSATTVEPRSWGAIKGLFR